MIVNYKFEATLKVDKDPEATMQSIKQDMMHTKRSSTIAEKKDNYVLFHIKAEDTTALKASFLSLIKMLEVKDKISKLVEEE